MIGERERDAQLAHTEEEEDATEATQHTADSSKQMKPQRETRVFVFFEFLELTNTKTTEENTKLLLGALKRAYQQVGNKPLYVIMIPQIGMNCVSLYILCFLNVNLAI